MVYCFDIDGTICSNTDGDYHKADPRPDVIQKINALLDYGHTIYFYTARGATTGLDWRELTEKQLHEWGVRYHRLYFGKPTADFYVDDKSINIEDWLKEG